MTRSSLASGFSVRPGSVVEIDLFANFFLQDPLAIGRPLEAHHVGAQTDFTEFLFRRINEGTGRFFVAECDGKIVGTSGAVISETSKAIQGVSEGYLFGLRLLPELGQHKIILELAMSSIAFLCENGCVRIRVRSSGADDLYRSLGFKAVSELQLP